MSIEITDQMIYAFAGEPEITASDAHAIEVGLTAVFALVERNYVLRSKCGSPGSDSLACFRVPGHEGRHADARSGRLVRW